MVKKSSNTPVSSITKKNFSSSHWSTNISVDNILKLWVSEEILHILLEIVQELGVFFSIHKWEEMVSEESQEQKRHISSLWDQLGQRIDTDISNLDREVFFVIRQIQHLIQPLSIISTTESERDRYTGTKIENVLDKTIEVIFSWYHYIGEMKRAQELLTLNISFLQEIAKWNIYIWKEEVRKLIEEIFQDSDMTISFTRKWNKKINQIYFFVIIENILTNYKKYGKNWKLLIDFWKSTYSISTSNKIKELDFDNIPHTWGEWFNLFRLITSYQGGEIKNYKEEDEKWEDIFYLELSDLSYNFT